jgi:predicted DNA-binding protein (UPF0278 family)
MFGKLIESRRKSYREALISGEVDTFPDRVDCSLSRTSIGTSRASNSIKSVGTVSTRTSMTPAERAINRTQAEHQRNLEIKIENLQQLAQKQLDNVIEDMLPKYRLMPHPSHPCFAQEYPILADIQ